MMKYLASRLGMPLVGAAGLFVVGSAMPAAAAVAIPQDVQVTLQTRNSTTNPGPFSSGSATTFNASFRIDGSVMPTGGVPTFTGALNDLVIQITDQTLGSFTIEAQSGRLQQLELGTNSDSMLGGWGSFHGGSIVPFAAFNLALSDSPFVLESVAFDFRGAQFYDNPQDLPTSLSHSAAPGTSDFSFLDLTLRFGNVDPNMGVIEKTSIIRYAAFDTVTVSAVPEPAAVSMLLAGLLLIGATARRRVAR